MQKNVESEDGAVNLTFAPAFSSWVIKVKVVSLVLYLCERWLKDGNIISAEWGADVNIQQGAFWLIERFASGEEEIQQIDLMIWK